MKKRFGLARIVIGVIACIVGIYFYFSDGDGLNFWSKESGTENKDPETVIEKSYQAEASPIELLKYDHMGEKRLIQEVHNMTHQKVHAKQKWGSSEVTADKVEKLYEVVMGNSFKKAEAKEMLLEILEPWKRGDFSNAVVAHNQIWSYQKGTIGRATRLLTTEEELKYIEKEF
jgi:Family of unknown function (DUF6241)